MITLSRLGHVAACPGYASLPHQARASGPAATLGTAIHEMIEHVVSGQGEARDVAHLWADILSPDDEGRLGFLAEHMRLPIPTGALAETSLGYFPDGSVRRIEGGAGSYPDAGQWLSGQLDLMWAEPKPLLHYLEQPEGWPEEAHCYEGSTLWIADIKTGSEDNVPPIARNWQLRGGAVLAARWTGATRVIPAICYVNAAECAEAVRAGRPYEGRWEVGAPLDAAALDAIEVEMRAVLARARGEEDGRAETETRVTGGEVRSGDEVRQEDQGDRLVSPPLILGPYCEHCDARVHCPAFAGEALSLLEGWEQHEAKRNDPKSRRLRGRERETELLPGDRGGLGGVVDEAAAPLQEAAAVEAIATAIMEGGARGGLPVLPDAVGEGLSGGRTALNSLSASALASIIPALLSQLKQADAAVRVYIEAHGPLMLSDGRIYGPVLEEVTVYRTAPTFDALADVVGEEAANDAAEYTGAGLKRALEGQSRGAWGKLRRELEARGAVVVSEREKWTRRYPVKPVEVEDGERCGVSDSGDGAAVAGEWTAEQRGASGEEDPGGRRHVGSSVHAATSDSRHGAWNDPVGGSGLEPAHAQPSCADRKVAVCSACLRSFSVNKNGRLRRHWVPGGGDYCNGVRV